MKFFAIAALVMTSQALRIKQQTVATDDAGDIADEAIAAIDANDDDKISLTELSSSTLPRRSTPNTALVPMLMETIALMRPGRRKGKEMAQDGFQGRRHQRRQVCRQEGARCRHQEAHVSFLLL